LSAPELLLALFQPDYSFGLSGYELVRSANEPKRYGIGRASAFLVYLLKAAIPFP
jgi:hypothetical protein